MIFCKLYQIDAQYQLLVQIKTIAGYRNNGCIVYTTAINGQVMSIFFDYSDDDELDSVFDKIDERKAEEMFGWLWDRYLEIQRDNN